MSNIGKSSLVRRVAAAAGALALGLAGLAGAAAAANAADPVILQGNIQAGQPTTLTIHKYSGLEASTHDNGLPKDIDASHQPLQGVKFNITPVTAKGTQQLNANAIDTDPKAWDLISGPDGKTPLDVTTVTEANGYTFGPSIEVTTDASGIGRLDNGTGDVPTLPHGLYLVQEGDDTGNNNIVSKTAPFLVTLPLPKGAAASIDNGSWIYDVNVYPKNQLLAGPVKTIKPENPTDGQTGLKIGDKVQYTIDQIVPSLNAGEKYTSASIFDYLNPDELQFANTVSVQVGTKDDEGNFTGSAAPYTYDAANAAWNLTATEPGANPGDPSTINLTAGQVVRVVFTAKVLKVTESGVVDNAPWNNQPGQPGYGSEFNGKKVPGTTTPHSYWGQLQVTKVVQGNTSQKLAGAEFAVAELPATQNTCSPTAPAAADAVATGTSDDNGIVQWNSTPSNPLGLFVANSDTDPNPADFSKDYCLYETKAPAGYILKDAPQKVTITPGTTLTAGANDITVEDEQQNHPNLPLTGAAGTVVMTLGGIALVAAGGAAYAISRKKQSAR
ncbi:SpaH/EbpB family LPXTG-anchored major pilin [Bifidobacterium tibiigranuli]|jgi:fimbrial isopeptide formation D2 family protein/LPXTG-motif cell wall-anchored protein|uniref:SpaH/EbpB family LPXTG-anchored major pilin n=1 Tax=Bifidobacterium tibiigranuli TaxID=2172043 RepID=UPI0026EF6CF3|nr:SpaH/EbpB family LPXTG-anchored major pilin [Bifidobacterium tibiigranuli]MCI1649452.1 SpaH/EbpB family LPXTG-anchored major pilin [Bifidobacterium tibiigranuli]MCI2186186.1 SpaH/EbpB family LPXTG-anchored major pilin [Bifidobacterium tibiigranuli]MCI2203987.1 SpaH/EbpB family LPXTG-anchored major pilin [Bifidobacterium tibiigranuli]